MKYISTRGTAPALGFEDVVLTGLASDGGLIVAQDASKQMTDLALTSLREADPQGEVGEALFELADKLLKRDQ